MNEVYAVLDIGSATIELLVGEIMNSNLHVLFSKKVPSHGVKKGIIEDERLLVNDIKAIVQEANEFLEGKIKAIGLTIPTIRSKLYQSNSTVSLNHEAKITKDDIVRGLKLSTKFKRSSEEEVVCVIPVKFNGDFGISNQPPIGESSRNLIVDTLVITSQKHILYPYIMAVEKAGLEVMDICINAFACAKEAFDAVYLQEGAVLIDMGYKTSTISFYKDGYLKYLTVCSVGGYNLTRAIAQNLQISMNQAEAYKIKYGSLDYTIGQEDIIHSTELPDGRKDYTQKDFAHILEEATVDVLNVIKEKLQIIDDGGHYETLIVGGGGELEMLDKVAGNVLEGPVRVYRPDIIGIRDMAFVSAVGMIFYMSDCAKYLGTYETSVVLPDISNTMAVKFKGLTKTKDTKEKTGRFSRLLDTFFGEEE